MRLGNGLATTEQAAFEGLKYCLGEHTLEHQGDGSIHANGITQTGLASRGAKDPCVLISDETDSIG